MSTPATWVKSCMAPIILVRASPIFRCTDFKVIVAQPPILQAIATAVETIGTLRRYTCVAKVTGSEIGNVGGYKLRMSSVRVRYSWHDDHLQHFQLVVAPFFPAASPTPT